MRSMKRQNGRLRDCETGRIVVPHLEVAASLWAQTRGLIGRAALPAGAGLLIPHCNAIHTAFVRFPIDAAFLDREGTVVKLVSDLPPWRIVGPVRGAKSVVELPAGTLRQQRIAVGGRLSVDTVESSTPGERA